MQKLELVFIHYNISFIVSQTVKDVLQGLIDDNLVDQDKIGASNIYWAFPSKALVVVYTIVFKLYRETQKLIN